MRTSEPTGIKHFEEYLRTINLKKSKKVNNAFNDDIYEFGGTGKLCPRCNEDTEKTDRKLTLTVL